MSCPNCGYQLQGQFCFQCGQNQRDMNRFFWSLVNETFEDIFSLNSRFSRTVSNLILRPGFISNEYVSGRKARYIPPLRLYLVTSLILFLFLTAQNALMGTEGKVPVTIDTTGVTEVTASDSASAGESSEAQINDTIEKELGNIEIEFLSDQQVETLKAKIREQASKTYHVLKEEPSVIYSILLDTLPSMMFVLLPLFALLMKLTYLSSGRYYTEHLVFTLHSQCFVYIMVLTTQILQLIDSSSTLGTIASWITFFLNLWVPLYLILALKLFYGQGLAITLFKFVFLSLMYSILLFGVFMVAMIWGFFTL